MEDDGQHHSLALIEAAAKFRQDQEWRQRIVDEAARQVLETNDADALADKWTPLVCSVTKSER